MEFARDLAEAESGPGRINFRRFRSIPFKNEEADPTEIVDAIIHQLGLGTGPLAISSTQRDVLIDSATGGGVVTQIDFSKKNTDDVYDYVRPTIALALQMAENQVF